MVGMRIVPGVSYRTLLLIFIAFPPVIVIRVVPLWIALLVVIPVVALVAPSFVISWPLFWLLALVRGLVLLVF